MPPGQAARKTAPPGAHRFPAISGNGPRERRERCDPGVDFPPFGDGQSGPAASPFLLSIVVEHDPGRVRLPVGEELEPIWDRVRAELRQEVPDFKFHIWLEPLKLAAVEGDALYVAAPEHIRTWVRDRYLNLLVRAARRGHTSTARVEVVSCDWRPAANGGGAAPADDAAGHPPLAPRPPGTPLNPKYTFDQFVIGGCNQFAHAAALAVAEMPAQAYNPLFIHGRPGIGKTHLLHAIGNYVSVYGAGLSVRYATVEQFTTEFVQAVRSRDTQSFKERFRSVDLLLLDDVQFLADKTRTEEELFHTFNELIGSGRQLVMTADRTPDELVELERRLGERFGAGLVVQLDPPDLHVRRAILEKRAGLDAVEATPGLLEEIAERVQTSVRALEAALIQVVAYASLRGEPPTADLARRLLDRVGPNRDDEACTVTTILQATARQFDLRPDNLLARDRRPEVSRARKIAMYLARELTDESLPEIGRGFGGRDHTTVLHAVRSVQRDVSRDPQLAMTVDSLKRQLVPTV